MAIDRTVSFPLRRSAEAYAAMYPGSYIVDARTAHYVPDDNREYDMYIVFLP